MTESLNRIPLRMKSTHSQGYQNLIRINKEKGILILGKKYLRELKKYSRRIVIHNRNRQNWRNQVMLK